MKEIRVQPMTVSHVGEILEIEKDLFPTPWTRRMFEEEITRGAPATYAVVATLSNDVVGYAIAWFILDEVHLVNIAVHTDWQKRGVGTFLLNHVIDGAKAAEAVIITLEVRRSNAIAQAFYHSFGFKEIGVRQGYYSDNREDAVLMAADLERIVERRKRDAGQPHTH
jgi:ribosomal-protein-alanine N-acetyltransferase